MARVILHLSEEATAVVLLNDMMSLSNCLLKNCGYTVVLLSALVRKASFASKRLKQTKLQRINDYWMPSHMSQMGHLYYNSMAQRTLWKRGVRKMYDSEKEGKGVEYWLLSVVWLNCCTDELTAVVTTCTRSSLSTRVMEWGGYRINSSWRFGALTIGKVPIFLC